MLQLYWHIFSLTFWSTISIGNWILLPIDKEDMYLNVSFSFCITWEKEGHSITLSLSKTFVESIHHSMFTIIWLNGCKADEKNEIYNNSFGSDSKNIIYKSHLYLAKWTNSLFDHRTLCMLFKVCFQHLLLSLK